MSLKSNIYLATPRSQRFAFSRKFDENFRMDDAVEFEKKLEIYKSKTRSRNILLPIYRKLRIPPLEFWNPIYLFLFFMGFSHIFLSVFFGTAGLILKFSFERLILYLDFFFMWQLIALTVPIALFGTLMNLYLRRHLSLGKWEDLK